MRFWTFSSDRRLLMAVLMLFWRLNLQSAATLETGITSATFAKDLKLGNISPSEVIRSRQDSLNERLSCKHSLQREEIPQHVLQWFSRTSHRRAPKPPVHSSSTRCQHPDSKMH